MLTHRIALFLSTLDNIGTAMSSLVNTESVFGSKPPTPELLAHQSRLHAPSRQHLQTANVTFTEEVARRIAELTAWIEEPAFRQSLGAFVARKGLVRQRDRSPTIGCVTINPRNSCSIFISALTDQQLLFL